MILGKWGMLGVFGAPSGDANLELLARTDFEMCCKEPIRAYSQKLNREPIKLKVIDNQGLSVDENDFLLFGENGIREIKIFSNGQCISSETDALTINNDVELLPRLGDIEFQEEGSYHFSIVAYVSNIDKGIVLMTKGLSKYKPIKFIRI